MRKTALLAESKHGPPATPQVACFAKLLLKICPTHSRLSPSHLQLSLPAAVDVIDLIVLVECHSLHTVCEWSIQHSDTWALKRHQLLTKKLEIVHILQVGCQVVGRCM